MLELAGNLILGAGLGFLGGMLGIGGGLLAIPVLGLLYGMDQQLAQGTAMVMVVPNILLSVYKYNQHNRIDWRKASCLAGAALVMSWLGALVAIQLDPDTMRKAFVIFMVCIAAWTLLQMVVPKRPDRLEQTSLPVFAALGGGAGLSGGLFGIGSAVVVTPVLTMFIGASQVVAQGLALSVAVPATIATLVTYGIHEKINWAIGASMAVSALLFVGLGVKVAHHLPQKLLKVFFSLFVLLCAGLLYSIA